MLTLKISQNVNSLWPPLFSCRSQVQRKRSAQGMSVLAQDSWAINMAYSQDFDGLRLICRAMTHMRRHCSRMQQRRSTTCWEMQAAPTWSALARALPAHPSTSGESPQLCYHIHGCHIISVHCDLYMQLPRWM